MHAANPPAQPALLAAGDGPRTRWIGERWSPPARIAAVAVAMLLYAIAYVPLFHVGGRAGIAPLATVLVAGAAVLLGLRGGLLCAAALLPLHTLLLNAAGEPGWDAILRVGGALGSVVLFVIGGVVGFLSDLARRVEARGRDVTAQRAALAAEIDARQHAEARYRDLVENAADLIYTHDLDGRLTGVNTAVEAALGYSREELIGTPVDDLIAPAHRARARAALERLLAGEPAEPYQLDALASDEEPVPLEVSAWLLHRDGQPIEVETIARDVRERRGAEMALQQSEARFRAMFEGAGVGVAVTNLFGQVTESNAALAAMLGRDVSELRGRLLVDLARPSDAAEVAAIVRAWRDGADGPHEAEVELARADGQAVCAALTASLVRDDRGGPWFGLVVAEDCTERVRQRERRAGLLRAARRLAARADREEVLADLLIDVKVLLGADVAAVFRVDEERGALVLTNASLASLADLPPVPIGLGALGVAAERREPVVIHDYTRHPNSVPALLAAGVRAAAAAPLLDEGQLLGVLWAASTSDDQAFDPADVEVLELLAEAAAATLLGLERARLAGALLAARTAEHELNNRLAPVVGYAELVAADPRLPEDLREMALLAQRGAEDAAAIVKRLRGITRLDETEWGPSIGTTIDVARSTGQGATPSA